VRACRQHIVTYRVKQSAARRTATRRRKLQRCDSTRGRLALVLLGWGTAGGASRRRPRCCYTDSLDRDDAVRWFVRSDRASLTDQLLPALALEHKLRNGEHPVAPAVLKVTSLIRQKGYTRLPQAVRLAGGQLSADYVDGKVAVGAGEDLALVASAMIDTARELTTFTVIGGLTMGADPFAHAVAVLAPCKWISVRKQPKGRGLDKWIEGGPLTTSDRVLLVDDVVTSGNSIITAYNRVIAAGASVVAAIAMVDRGESVKKRFDRVGVPYRALVTYADLGISPVDANGQQLAGAAR
jgi:orotate phosphoribosyltransferase